MARHRIESVRPAPAGFAEGSLALVTFTYAPSEHDGPLKFSRYVKPAQGESEGKRYEVASVVGARSVKVIDAVLREHQGRYYVSTGDIDVPRDVRSAVGEAAWREFNRAKQPAAAGDVEGDGGFDPDIPF